MKIEAEKLGKWQELSMLIVGCGSIGKRHARVLDGLGVNKLCLCDPSEHQRKAALKKIGHADEVNNLESGLDLHPDVVFICTQPSMHIQQAMQAINAGCDVFTEKPLSDKLDNIDKLAELINRTGKKFMVGLCFRYHEGLLKAKQMLDNGKIGSLISIRSLMGEYLPEVRPDYLNMYLSQYNGAFDLMHDIDLALWYAGREVDTVYCIYGTYSDIGIKAPDIVEVLIGFLDSCVASVHLDFFQRPRRRQIELIGTKGTIIVEFGRWDQCTISFYDISKKSWNKEVIITDRDDMFRAEDKEFLNAVADDLPIKTTLSEGLKSLNVILSAQNSSARKK